MGSDGADAPGRTTLVQIEGAALDEARLAFHRTHPGRSAKRVFHFTQIAWIAVLIAGAATALWFYRAHALTALHIAALGLFTAAILLRLFAAANIAPLLSRIASPPEWPIYTILCPLYREANVAADLIAALQRIDYPSHALDIKLILEADDTETLATIGAAVMTSAFEVLILPDGAPRTKPKALNVGLAKARGEFIVVYDAEDRPDPQQLRAALAAFEDGGADLACVQAPLAIDNADASWIARQFAAEYAIQFSEVLPLLARLRLPLPLGGTSNHFRTEALKAAGGWDPFNVSEDRRKFAKRNVHLQRGTFHVPLLSQTRASAA